MHNFALFRIVCNTIQSNLRFLKLAAYMSFYADDKPVHPGSFDWILPARGIRVYHHQGVQAVSTGSWVNHFGLIFYLECKNKMTPPVLNAGRTVKFELHIRGWIQFQVPLQTPKNWKFLYNSKSENKLNFNHSNFLMEVKSIIWWSNWKQQQDCCKA